MQKEEVIYQGGESITKPGQAIDYMMVAIDDILLYAEAEAVSSSETASYVPLKAEITAQAEANGIDVNRLIFWEG